MVVDKNNKVEICSITAGNIYDVDIVVKAGLKAGERVITQGLQKVRAGMIVKPVLGVDKSKKTDNPAEMSKDKTTPKKSAATKVAPQKAPAKKPAPAAITQTKPVINKTEPKAQSFKKKFE